MIRRLNLVALALFFVPLIASISLVAAQLSTNGFTSSGLPVPCRTDSAVVYLIINGTRHAIPDDQTFRDLGYQASDLIPCGTDSTDPESAPVTTLFKTTNSDLYILKAGTRHLIPDLATLYAYGYTLANVTALPDDVIARWPIGSVAPSTADSLNDSQKVSYKH